METDRQQTAKTLGDFVLSHFTPELVSTVISSQRQRIQTTLVGFGLIQQTYSIEIPMVTEIIGYALSSVDKFDGLSSIMKIIQLTETQRVQVSTFFTRVLDTIRNNPDLIIVAFAFSVT
jgi:hypothetical protein